MVLHRAEGMPPTEVRTLGTMTQDWVALADWLAEAGCTHVAMESTGVYWQSVYNVLEGQFALLLVNARHMKHEGGTRAQDRCEGP